MKLFLFVQKSFNILRGAVMETFIIIFRLIEDIFFLPFFNIPIFAKVLSGIIKSMSWQ